jgi:hypothetical protein
MMAGLVVCVCAITVAWCMEGETMLTGDGSCMLSNSACIREARAPAMTA